MGGAPWPLTQRRLVSTKVWRHKRRGLFGVAKIDNVNRLDHHRNCTQILPIIKKQVLHYRAIVVYLKIGFNTQNTSAYRGCVSPGVVTVIQALFREFEYQSVANSWHSYAKMHRQTPRPDDIVGILWTDSVRHRVELVVSVDALEIHLFRI